MDPGRGAPRRHPQLGSAESLKEQYREQRGVPSWTTSARTSATRGAPSAAAPASPLVAVVTIALGVAGPTITFSMVKAWILEPLPFAEPEGSSTSGGSIHADRRYGLAECGGFPRFQAQSPVPSARLPATAQTEVRLTGGDRAERLRAALVTANFFDVLGVRAAIGRVFDATDERGRPIAAGS